MQKAMILNDYPGSQDKSDGGHNTIIENMKE